jgi:prephenate dehydratase
MRLAHLGPAGTNTEAAAVDYDPTAELLPVPTVAEAIHAVERGDADAAVCAIENSLEGPVADTLAELVRDERTLVLAGEVVIAIRHALVGVPGLDPTQVSTVYSHPQALAQTRETLAKVAPNAHPVAALSTSAAIEAAVNEPGTLAVGNVRAAALFHAHVYIEDVSDLPNNQTRFVVFAAAPHSPTGDDKTSLVFTMAHDRPGSLVEVLQPFADRRINMTRIESRPTRRRLGTYYFFADVQGHETDPDVAAAIEEARPHTEWLHVVGSYPRWTGNDA